MVQVNKHASPLLLTTTTPSRSPSLRLTCGFNQFPPIKVVPIPPPKCLFPDTPSHKLIPLDLSCPVSTPQKLLHKRFNHLNSTIQSILFNKRACTQALSRAMLSSKSLPYRKSYLFPSFFCCADAYFQVFPAPFVPMQYHPSPIASFPSIP